MLKLTYPLLKMSANLNNRANQLNPNNIQYYRSRGLDARPRDFNNRANQLNPNNYAYYRSRGLDGIPNAYNNLNYIFGGSNAIINYYSTDDEANSRPAVNKGYYSDSTDDEANLRPAVNKGYYSDSTDDEANSRPAVNNGYYSDSTDDEAISRPAVNNGYYSDSTDDETNISPVNNNGYLTDTSDDEANSRPSINNSYHSDSTDDETNISPVNNNFGYLTDTSDDDSVVRDTDINYEKIIKFNHLSYPYNFNPTDDSYGDTPLGDYIWLNKSNISKFCKYNNLPKVKKSSSKLPNRYFTNFPEIDIYCNCGIPKRSETSKFGLHLSVNIKKHFNNIKKEKATASALLEDLENIFKFKKNNYTRLTSKQEESLFNLKNKYNPYLVLYVLKDDTIVINNEYNQEIFYQYKLSGEHANKAITNICLLDNDNIKLELNKNELVELNLFTSELKSFLFEPEPIRKDQAELTIEEIKKIINNYNINTKDKLEMIKKLNIR